MRENIINFCSQYQYPQEAKEELLSVYDAVSDTAAVKEIFSQARQEYEHDLQLDYPALLARLKNACSQERIPWETASLLFFICLTPQLFRHYEQSGLPAEICRASLEDLKWKLMECRQVYGVWGTFVSDWFPGFFRMTRFTLGRLQFELIPFPDNYIRAGREKPKGLNQAINIHIPSSGPLLHRDCLRSYELAMEFFRPAFPDGTYAFFCLSWLLFPDHRRFLPANSRILEFMADFDIYDAYQDPAGEDLWRIFGKPDCSDTAGLPENTSLQTAYKNWPMTGNKPGIGLGMILKGA